MANASLKLPDKLKGRIASAARARGMTPHAFMVEALETETRRAEKRRAFVAAALTADREMRESGVGYPSEEVHAWLRAAASGKPAALPRAKKWRG